MPSDDSRKARAQSGLRQVEPRVRAALRDRSAEIASQRLSLVLAPGGSGKTTLLESWRSNLEAEGALTAWISLTHLHADPGVFLGEWVESTRAAIAAQSETGADFAAELLRDLPHIDRPDEQGLLRRVHAACRELPRPLTLFLDNYHLLDRDSLTDRLLELLLRTALPLRFVIASRGMRPVASARLLAEGNASELGAEDLNLRAREVEALLAARGIRIAEDLVPRLLAQTRGWVTGVLLAARALERRPPEEHAEFVGSLARQRDLFEYVAGEVIAGEPGEIVELLELAAVLGPCGEKTLAAAHSERADTTLVQQASDKGLLLVSGDRVAIHQLWEAFLRRRLEQRLSRDEWRELHARMARQIGDGDPERALGICGEGDVVEGIADLLEHHGRAWVDRGRAQMVEEWLARIPQPLCQARPGLQHVEGLVLRRRDTDAALDRLRAAARGYRDAGDRMAEAAALHDALIIAANENRPRAYGGVLRQLVSLRRLVSEPRVRALSVLSLAALAALSGRWRLAERLLRRVHRDALGPTERAGVMIGLVVVGKHSDWDRTHALLEEALADPQQREHAPSFFTLQLEHATLEGLRGQEPERSLERAEEARAALREFRLTMSEAGACEAVGQLHSHAGRRQEAHAAFERGLELAERTGQWDFEGLIRGLRAREFLLQGEPAAALEESRRAAALYDSHGRRRSPLFFRGSLVARMLADAGDPEAAQAFAERHRRRLRVPDLPIAQHACLVQLARVAHLNGDSELAREQLAAARAALARGAVRDTSPDLDPDLLAWAEAEAGGAASPAAPDGSDTWRIQSLGGLAVWRGDVEIEDRAWRGSTTRRLFLRLLAAGDQAVRREQLELELWPELPQERARNNLRVSLSRLRSTLGADALSAKPTWLRLAPAVRAGWDVARFEAAFAPECGDAAARCAALDLYRGPFAPEYFDDWAEELRRSLEGRFLSHGRALAEALLEAGDTAEAERVATHLTEQVASDEASWALRARSQLAAGDRAAALRSLDQARSALRRELDIDPGPQLIELEAQAREG